jgi:glycosyltransferase involved in cell wall biosynthesis
MKKILFISGIQLFPPESGGQLRSANICLSLAQMGHIVEIYSLTGRKKDYLSRASSGQTKINNHLSEYVNRNPLWGLLQYLTYKMKLPPFWITWLTKFYCPKKLKNNIENTTVILDFPYLYPLGNKFSSVIVNTHNAEFELYMHSKILPGLVKKIELSAFEKANDIFFCHHNDFEKFSDHIPTLQEKAHILPNGVQLEQFVFDKNKREEIRKNLNINNDSTVYLFTGSKYLPNVRAYEKIVKWAHNHAEELITEKVTIIVAGTVSENVLNSTYLKVVGRVSEMLPYFWAADFGLNVVMEGSGTNVKMIEFMAAHLPILTTTFGARGINLIDQQTCLYFELNNLLETIRKANQLDHAQRKSMAQAAFTANQNVIDMGHALKNLSINW